MSPYELLHPGTFVDKVTMVDSIPLSTTITRTFTSTTSTTTGGDNSIIVIFQKKQQQKQQQQKR